MDNLSGIIILIVVLLAGIALVGALMPLYKNYQEQQAALKKQAEQKVLFQKPASSTESQPVTKKQNEPEINHNAAQRQIISSDHTPR